MARRVVFHVGTLKTGTTYLQKVMWENRAALAESGVLFAGEYYRDRVWATQTVRGMGTPHARARTAWDRITRQVNEFPGDAVISHEFFGGASEEQAQAAKDRFPDAEISVVVTARDLVGIFPAFWQEQVKFGFTDAFADYDPLPLESPPNKHWSWRTIDAADVLRRWSGGLPPERVAVVTMPPPGSPRDLLWRRFSDACGFDGSVASLDLPAVNESMGVAETELLRRVNEGLAEELRPSPEPARWVRGYLGLDVLAPRRGEKLRVTPARAAVLRERGEQIVAGIRDAGYRVVGELDDVVGPAEVPEARQPEEVDDAELLSVALDTINTMLVDHRRLSLENDRLRRAGKSAAASGESAQAAGSPRPASVLRKVFGR